MKRFLLCAFSLITAMSASAYYGSYGYSSSEFKMPGWFVFMSIVMIVFGILGIILFFKIWGMTNDIKALKKDHFCETTFENQSQMASYLRKNLVLGNMDNVKRILLQKFIDNVEHAFNDLPTGRFELDENDITKWVSYEEKNLKKSIAPFVNNLIMQYAKIGEEAPVYIARMSTFGDYYNLFTKEDFNVFVTNTQDSQKA